MPACVKSGLVKAELFNGEEERQREKKVDVVRWLKLRVLFFPPFFTGIGI